MRHSCRAAQLRADASSPHRLSFSDLRWPVSFTGTVHALSKKKGTVHAKKKELCVFIISAHIYPKKYFPDFI
jgi:hypothetical protein